MNHGRTHLYARVYIYMYIFNHTVCKYYRIACRKTRGEGEKLDIGRSPPPPPPHSSATTRRAAAPSPDERM